MNPDEKRIEEQQGFGGKKNKILVEMS